MAEKENKAIAGQQRAIVGTAPRTERFEVRTPYKAFNGERCGVKFTEGVGYFDLAEATPEGVMPLDEWFASQGYEVIDRGGKSRGEAKNKARTLEDMTIAEILEDASKHGLTPPDGLKKAELIEWYVHTLPASN